MSASTSTTILRCALLAGGLLLAAATMPLAEVGVLFCLASFMAALTLVLLSGDLEGQNDVGVRRAVVRSVLAPAVVGGVTTIGLAAVATISVRAALLVLVAVLCCSPRVRAATRAAFPSSASQQRSPAPSVRRRGTLAVPRQRGGRPASPPVGALSDQELCTRWTESFAALQITTSADERAELADWRRSCLDELEERDPQAVAAWLRSHANAASGLEGYFLPGT